MERRTGSVPDLLGDTLLARAASIRETGAPTEYLDRVHHAAGGAAMANLIVNASRIDWQEPEVRRGRLVESFWAAVRPNSRPETPRLGPLCWIPGQSRLLPTAPSLAMTRWALEHPAASAQADAGLGLSYTYTDRDVSDAAAPVLRNAGV